MAEEDKIGASDAEEELEEEESLSYRSYLSKEPWWVILIAGIVTLGFGAIILAWPLMTLGFLVVFFGTLAIIMGAIALIRSLFLIRTDKGWWVLLIEGILGIIIGIFIFIWPTGTTIFLIYFIAVWLIITGISSIANGSSTKNTPRIVIGVLSLILGIFVLFRPPLYATSTLLTFIGFFAVFSGIAWIVNSIILAVVQKRERNANKAAA